MPTFTFSAFVNVSPDNFYGYKSSSQLAPVTVPGSQDPIEFQVKALEPMAVLELAFSIGNRMDADDNGIIWPSDIRSMSVGDLVKVTATTPNGSVQAFYACASFGWDEVIEPTNPLLVVDGTNATSRPARFDV